MNKLRTVDVVDVQGGYAEVHFDKHFVHIKTPSWMQPQANQASCTMDLAVSIAQAILDYKARSEVFA